MSSIIFPKDVLNIIAKKIADADKIERLDRVLSAICCRKGLSVAYCSVSGCKSWLLADGMKEDSTIWLYDCTFMLQCRNCDLGTFICNHHRTKLARPSDDPHKQHCITCGEKLHIY